MIPYSEQTAFRQNIPSCHEHSDLDFFYANAYHDMRFFLHSITQADSNSCVYFGDIRKDIYYLSDNMVQAFAFPGHIVHDFFRQWRDRIYGDKYREIFDQSLKRAFEKKRDIIDLRQQVVGWSGKVVWIRFYAAIQWDARREEALFFASRISRQDEVFEVDPITNFPTTNTLQFFLKDSLETESTYQTVGFCYNYIPQLNSTYGRCIVDRFIRKTSQHIMDHLSEYATFYRLPGVRCLAVLEHSNPFSVAQIIEKIQDVIQYEYENLGAVVPRPCSFAVMQYPRPGAALAPEDFQEAMVSLLKVARRDPNASFIEDTAYNISRVQEIGNMEIMIKRDILLDMHNFRPVIQPIVSSETGKIVGGETLMRWQYNGKDMSPGVFIPILESDDTIHIAGRWIMEQAVKACSRIIRSIPDFYLTVNLSLQQLYDPQLLTFIPYILKKYGLDGRHLVIETTESCLDTEPEIVQKFMDLCHQNGIRIALDDFGTGYSSLRVLLKYSTDIVKLDRSLLLEMSESVKKYNFISSIVFACHQFGKIVCVEGVETEAHRDLVRSAGCDTIQGFYFYRPTELEDVYRLVQEHGE